MTAVLVTVSGPDRPGVSGALFAALTSESADVVDVEQVVVHGALTLGVLATTAGNPAHLLRQIERTMRPWGMTVRTVIDPPPAGELPSTHRLLVIGNPLPAHAIAELTAELARGQININAIHTVRDGEISGLELDVSAPDSRALTSSITGLAQRTGADIAIQESGRQRRALRLIVFDVDSTLITGEVIEMLAQRTGTRPQVQEITERAMRGELDFAESLRQRVAMLAGLPATVLDEVGRDLPLTPGARHTVETLQRTGFRCGIVSGGFTQVAQYLADDLGLDFVAANTLEVVDGVLTGKLVGEIVDRAGKAAALRRFAEKYQIPLSQTVAVGDGANDIDMLTTAGLGIAFNAKPVVTQHVHAAVSHASMAPVLFILGVTADKT